jgi:hypothetical protein
MEKRSECLESWGRIRPLPNFILPDHRIVLRNPEARRSGILGVLGREYDWSQAECEFGQVLFTNVATRVKGNIASLLSKRPFKLDLNKFERGQKLGGVDELTFDSLAFDYSCLSEALAYEFFRDAGVHLEDFVARLYVPERLNQRIDAIAAVIREPIAAESSYRLNKFDQTVGLKPVAPGKRWDVLDFPASDLKQFIAGRARSVRSQLAGDSQGIRLKHPKLL